MPSLTLTQDQQDQQDQQNLRKRISEAVNVSPLLDNCFFHSLALYFLANKIDLPTDLFANFENEVPAVVELKKIIHSVESLDLFENYTNFVHSQPSPYPLHLVEKSVVLGIFFRSWFVKHLLDDEQKRQALFRSERAQDQDGVDDSDITFMSLIESYVSAKHQDIANDNNEMMESFYMLVEQNPIYLANRDFFRNLPDDYSEEECLSYWNSAGYQNYCVYLRGRVKISHSDVASVLQSMGFPYVIYNRGNASPIVQYSPQTTAFPSFELALDAGEGHYYFLETEQTRTSLDEYRAQYSSYQVEREFVLRDSARIPQNLRQASSLLLAAIFPSGLISSLPLDSVLMRLKYFKEVVNDPAAYLRVLSSAGNHQKLGPKEDLDKQIERQIEQITASLRLLHSKKSEYERKRDTHQQGLSQEELVEYKRKYDAAINAISDLHDKISESLRVFKNEKTEANYLTFKITSLKAIDEHKPLLAQHRDDHQFYANLVCFILGLGVFYGLCVLGNYLMHRGRCTFFETDAEQKLNRIEDTVNALVAVPI